MILHGRDALQLGLVKRVGDGSSVDVWTDPWIPGYSRRPLVKLPNASVAKVHELIDEHSGQWDMAEIQSNFVESDVETIGR